jgi:hypothetical protein
MKTTIVLMTMFSMLLYPALFAGSQTGIQDGKVAGTMSSNLPDHRFPAHDLMVIDLEVQNSRNSLPPDLLSQFREAIGYPKHTTGAAEKEVVVVGFTYDDDGYVRVEQSLAGNESFRKHVVENIERIRLRNGSVIIGKLYYARFSFKKL